MASETITCVHCSTAFDETCEQCLEEHDTVTARVSARSVLRQVEADLRKRAGVLFGEGHEDVAREVRSLADSYKKQAEEVSRQVDQARHVVEESASYIAGERARAERETAE